MVRLGCGCILLCIIAIILPPLAVFLRVGCEGHFFLNIILTILAWFPGQLHALFVVIADNP